MREGRGGETERNMEYYMYLNVFVYDWYIIMCSILYNDVLYIVPLCINLNIYKYIIEI